MIVRELLPFLGIEINGDVAGLTTYTNHAGKVVSYFAAPALKPPTPAQSLHRNRFRTAVRMWKDLPQSEQEKLQAVCDALSLCCWSLNLWITLDAQADDSLWQTLVDQTSIPIPNPRRLR